MAVSAVPQSQAAANRTMSLDRNLLNSPPPYLAFRTPDLRSHISSLPSPPPFSSPLAHSPISPMSSPRSYRSPLDQQAYLHGSEQQLYSSPVSPSYDVQSAAGIFSTGPGSAVSSDESHSPVDNALDADFEAFADFDAGYSYGYPAIAGTGYNSELLAAVASPMNRKQQLPESEGVHVPSPYLFTNGDLPFVGGAVKDGYYAYPDDVAGQTTYTTYLNGHPTIDTNISPIHVPSHQQQQQQHSYAFPSTPDSPFDTSGYYPSPVSATAIPAAYHSSQVPHHHPLVDTAASPMSAHVIMGDGGCDPRFVSASPSDLGSAFAGAGIHRFTGAFPSSQGGVADNFGYEDAEGEGEDEMDSGEEDRSEDDEGDDEYVDSNYGRSRRFVVPSQAPRDRSSAVHYPSSPMSASPSVMSPANLVSRSSSSRSAGASSRSSRPCAPAPIPVPNLTKKSRGRRVPTQPAAVLSAGEGTATKRMRGYTCRVAGCGKCFARGEHLKRHIRSIHTNEKREFALILILLFAC